MSSKSLAIAVLFLCACSSSNVPQAHAPQISRIEALKSVAIPGASILTEISVTFTKKSMRLENDQRHIIDEVLRSIGNRKISHITVIAGAKESMSEKYRLSLGEDRAKVIKGYLVMRGINHAIIDSISQLEEVWIAPRDCSQKQMAAEARCHHPASVGIIKIEMTR